MRSIKSIALILSCILLSATFIQCKDSNSVLKESQELKTVETSTPIAFADYYPSGNIKIKGQLLHDIKTGTWISYFENGDEKSI
nr:hypothetical protein [Nonlabens ulvanivorans]